MTAPVIVARENHSISRKDIDPDALRVLYRLNSSNHTAYLVGGSVRDLLLGRRPKDFDIGTSAHPYQIKRLFRNCWIIGRRFRLAHIKFGTKTIEVATFRRNVPDATPEPDAPAGAEAGSSSDEPVVVATSPHHDGLVHHENTFGTPEEDAFRRDFTINGLFYDIATFTVIDYVGGLGDLDQRVVRSIGDPNVRFVEDPVRMLRAAVLAARLGFEMDGAVLEAIARHRGLIRAASPARLIEEYYKILRSGCAEATFRTLARVRLLELLTPELADPSEAVWSSLAQLDAYRLRFPAAPPELTNPILIGSLLVPMGALTVRLPPSAGGHPQHERVAFGMLAVAKRDLERLRQLLLIAPRLGETDLPPRLVRSFPHRPAFNDALLWAEIFGDLPPDIVAQWTRAKTSRGHDHGHVQHGHGHAHPQQGHHGTGAGQGEPAAAQDGRPAGRRRRRRRRGRRRGGAPS